jgi:hypothetical protein
VQHGIGIDDQDFCPDRYDLDRGLKLALRIINNGRFFGFFKGFAFFDSFQKNDCSLNRIIGSENNPRFVSRTAANLLILRGNHFSGTREGSTELDLPFDRTAIRDLSFFIRPSGRRAYNESN